MSASTWRWVVGSALVCTFVAAFCLLAAHERTAPASAPAVVWRFGAPQSAVLTFATDSRDVAAILSDVGSSTGAPETFRLAVLSGASGTVKWDEPLASTAGSNDPLALDRNLVVTGTMRPATASGEYEFVARDARSGQVRWRAALPFRMASLSQLVLAKYEVIGYKRDTGDIWALARQSGELRWTTQVPRLAVGSPARLESDQLFVFWAESDPPYDAGVDCLSPQTGQRVWRRTLSSGSKLTYVRGLAEDGRVVFLWQTAPASPRSGQIERVQASCLNAPTGQRVWSGSLPYADLVFIGGESVYGIVGDVGAAGREHALWHANVHTGKLQAAVRREPAMAFLHSGPAPLLLDSTAALQTRGEGPLDLQNMRVVWLNLHTARVVGECGGIRRSLPSEFALLDGQVLCTLDSTHSIVALSQKR